MKKSKFHPVLISLAFSALFLLLSVITVQASTVIRSVDIHTDTTWTKANSPYVVYGDVYVLPGATLTIEPGTVIKLRYISSAMYITGQLVALGTPEEKIYFTSYKDDSLGGDTNGDGGASQPAPQDWNQLYAIQPGKINFAYVTVKYAGFYAGGASIHSVGGIATIASSTFSHSPLGIYQESFASTTVVASEFTKTNLGVFTNQSHLNITQSKFHDNDWAIYEYLSWPVEAQNNWWGDESGPYHRTLNPEGKGGEVRGQINFIPWLGWNPDLPPPPPPPPAGPSSVAFIPGIEASSLYRREQGCILINCENQLWAPNRNDDVRKLFMTPDGASADAGVYTRDAIKRVALIFPIYDSFLETMTGLVTDGTIAGFEALPYDWRFDLEAVVSRGATSTDGNISYINDLPAGQVPYMIAELEKLVAGSKNGKVTIVTHSNGGLVVKKLMRKLVEMKAAGQGNLVDKIDKVILVAVPELGTPEAVPGLLHGYKAGLPLVLSDAVAREAMENMPAVYNLLPSAKYFQAVNEPVVKINNSALSAAPGLSAYGSAIGSAGALSQFLLGELDGRPEPANDDIAAINVLNPRFVTSAAAVHSELDNWEYPTTTEVIQIAGWGVPTLKGLEYYSSDGEVLDITPLSTIDGDGTVVSPSAVGMVASEKTYFTNIKRYNEVAHKNTKHRNILEIPSLQELIKSIIIGTSTSPDYIGTVKPVDADEKNLLLSVHSPVTLDAYDGAGNHTGLIPNPDQNSDLPLVEENIPNSRYLNFGEGKYIVLPDGSYRVDLAGTGFGTFTFRQEEVVGGESTTTAVFTDILVTPATTATLNVSGNSDTTSMVMDVDGDGMDDYTIQPSATFDPVLYLTMMKTVVQSLALESKVEKQLLDKIDNVIKSLEDGKIEKVGKKVKQIIIKTSNDNRQRRNSKQLSQEDKDTLVIMLNQLLDNFK